MHLTSSQIEDAILAASETRWQKVAMVVFCAAKSLEKKLPQDSEGYDIVAKRLYGLVDSGRLVSQGDVTNWRHSEVRLP